MNVQTTFQTNRARVSPRKAQLPETVEPYLDVDGKTILRTPIIRRLGHGPWPGPVPQTLGAQQGASHSTAIPQSDIPLMSLHIQLRRNPPVPLADDGTHALGPASDASERTRERELERTVRELGLESVRVQGRLWNQRTSRKQQRIEAKYAREQNLKEEADVLVLLGIS